MKTRSILSISVLLAALSGCSITPVKVAVREYPPAYLLEDCPEPVAALRTNSDLAQWAVDLRAALRHCNNDKSALREWAKEIP